MTAPARRTAPLRETCLGLSLPVSVARTRRGRPSPQEPRQPRGLTLEPWRALGSKGAYGSQNDAPPLTCRMMLLREKRRARQSLTFGGAGTMHPISYIVIRLSTHRARVTHTAYDLNMKSLGGAAPSAAPTPRKRGPLPPRTGRRGRLPTWTAALCRPTSPSTTRLLYKRFLNAHCQRR